MRKSVYVLTARHDDAFIMWGKKCEVNGFGYVHMLNEGVAYPANTVYVNGEEPIRGELPPRIDLPDGVVPGEWCYTKEQGFFKNPDYEPPVEATAEVTEEAAE